MNNLTGIISPSFDKSEREFPFLIFYNLNKTYFNRIPANLIPLVSSRTLNAYKSLYEYSYVSDSLSSINDKMNNILYKISSEEAALEYQKFLSDTYQDVFWERTIGEFNNPIKFALINNLIKFLSDLRFKTNLNFSFGIKISFTSEIEYCELNLSFFIHLILVISNKLSYLPAMFWTFNENRVFLYLFFTKPSAQQFIDIIFQKDNEDRIIIAEKFEDQNKMMNSLHSSYKKLLEKNKLTLKELLRAFQQ
jgi:hypothetical protein